MDREKEIRAFVPEEYWLLNAKLSKDNKMVVCEHCKAKIERLEVSANIVEIAQIYSRHEIAIENIKWYQRHKK